MYKHGYEDEFYNEQQDIFNEEKLKEFARKEDE